MSVRLAVGPGDGWLARRRDGVLFTTEDWPSALHAFVEAADARAALDGVTGALVDAGFDVSPFVAVTWTGAVECVVFGDVAVQTEDPSAPMMSAAGSSTWIERRLTLGHDPLRMWAGTAAVEGSSLDAGIVPSGGFELLLDQLSESGATGDDIDIAQVAEPGEPGDVGAADVPSTPGAEVVVDAAEERARGIEALAAATGGDWMEESLGLRHPGGSSASSETSPTVAEPVVEQQVVAPAGLGEPTTETQRIELPPGLDDDESTWIPSAESLTPPPTPHAQGGALPPPAPHGTRRATAVLPDGSAVPIDGTVVFGRNPNRAAARVDDDARLVVVDASSSISRTHVTVHVEGSGTLTATDCGSRSGVVMVTPGREPVMLEPWVPQEISIGDTLYLGGPHGVRIESPSVGAG